MNYNSFLLSTTIIAEKNDLKEPTITLSKMLKHSLVSLQYLSMKSQESFLDVRFNVFLKKQ